LISVSVRPSLLDDDTAVLQIHNVSGGTLSGVVIRFHNLDSNQNRDHGLPPVPAGKQVEAGSRECNWAIEPKEEIKIEHSRYGQLAFTAYKTGKGTVGIRKALWRADESRCAAAG
jgi:hypothetical protein